MSSSLTGIETLPPFSLLKKEEAFPPPHAGLLDLSTDLSLTGSLPHSKTDQAILQKRSVFGEERKIPPVELRELGLFLPSNGDEPASFGSRINPYGQQPNSYHPLSRSSLYYPGLIEEKVFVRAPPP